MWNTRFSQLAQRTHRPQISWLMAKALEDPEIISLAAGFVDLHSLPYKQAGLELAKMLKDFPTGSAALQYGTTRGDAELRALLLHNLQAEGVVPPSTAATEEAVLLGSGSQQILYLLCETFLDPGDIVLLDAPTYFVVLGAFESHGAETIGLDTDEEGITFEALSQCLKRLETEGRLERVKMLYAMTFSANPTGLSWSLQRREAILSLLQHYRDKGLPILFLEDAAYRRLSFHDRQAPAVKRFDVDNEFVFYTESFSKTFSPGMRLGFGVGPQPIIDKMAQIKGNHDFGSSNLCQQLMRRVMKNGGFDKHVQKLRRVYRQKWDIAQRVLQEAFPPEAHWREPDGSFYIWITLPDTCDTGVQSRVFEAALNEKVLYVPGELCFSPDRPESRRSTSIRLSFGMTDENQLREGCRRLGRALQHVTHTV